MALLIVFNNSTKNIYTIIIYNRPEDVDFLIDNLSPLTIKHIEILNFKKILSYKKR